jgi:hypothetical protein
MRSLGTRMYEQALRWVRRRFRIATPPGGVPIIPPQPKHEPIEIDLDDLENHDGKQSPVRRRP